MPTTLPDWPREHFKKPGGKPYLFYVVYGRFGEFPALSASKYRSNGTPPGLQLSQYGADHQPDVLSRFQEGYLWNNLKSRRPALARKIGNTEQCLILRGELDDSPTLNYLRDAVGLLTFLV